MICVGCGYFANDEKKQHFLCDNCCTKLKDLINLIRTEEHKQKSDEIYEWDETSILQKALPKRSEKK